MARTRMSWDWVGNYPVFVYTTFLDNNVFNVKIVVGKRGDQNAPGYGPDANHYHKYVQTRLASKDEVVHMAFKIARRLMRKDATLG